MARVLLYLYWWKTDEHLIRLFGNKLPKIHLPLKGKAFLFASFVNCYGNRAVCANHGVVAHVEMMGLIEVDKATGFFKRKSSLPKRKRAFGFINLVRNGGRNPSVIFGL